jgi:uncharacterized membrane protein
VALGLIGFVFSDFALQWQPVPGTIPLRRPLIYASAASLLVSGSLLALKARRRWGAFALMLVFGIWVVALHLPRVVTSPRNIGAWLGLAELSALALAAALSAAVLFNKSGRGRRLLCILYGGCALVFGLSHFAYPAITAGLVPGWMPFPLFWAYFTGAAHGLAGLAIVAEKWARPAATLLGLMMGSFALLVHLPRVLASPHVHAEWTMLAMATCLAASALIVAQALKTRPAPDAEPQGG